MRSVMFGRNARVIASGVTWSSNRSRRSRRPASMSPQLPRSQAMSVSHRTARRIGHAGSDGEITASEQLQPLVTPAFGPLPPTVVHALPVRSPQGRG